MGRSKGTVSVNGLEDWESLLSESGQDQSILQWIATEFDDGNVALAAVVDQGSTAVDGGSNGGSGSSSSMPKISSKTSNPRASNLGFNNNNTQIPILGSSINNLFSSDLIYQLENPESNPQIFNPQVFINQHQQLSQLSQTQIQTQPSQHHLQQTPLMANRPALQSGSITSSLPLCQNPFKSLLFTSWKLFSSLFLCSTMSILCLLTPFDAMFKMGAYKLLSEASPVTHFMNFTSNQAILEALGYGGRVHIIDFDIGFDAMAAVHRSGEE
ncbi:Scarecrow-like protein 6 [Camellia lanceoleosa]|uniref:Scarecrow-like protein 6 n=1 Tax=Camellia lanceoleosa TaxID=1840588 RepID=A0ACC0I2Z6_9ERIC|nr:Scarecrow-like protein 6 [Camellia lanceoleosa]